MDKSINIITDVDGKKIVLINDVRFKSRRIVNWNEIEVYLKEYVGDFFEITETSEKIYIGSDFHQRLSVDHCCGGHYLSDSCICFL